MAPMARCRSRALLVLAAALVAASLAPTATAALTVALTGCGPVYNVTAAAWQVSCLANVTSDAATIADVDVQFGSETGPTVASCDTPITAFAGAGWDACNVTTALPAGVASTSLYAIATDGTVSSPQATVANVALGMGALSVDTATLPDLLRAGQSANVSVTLTNNGPTDLAPAALPSPGWAWADAACPGSSLAASTDGTPNTVVCIATYTAADADLELSAVKTWAFSLTAATLNAVVPSHTVTLPRSADISASVTGCTLSSARPASAATVICTATVTNTGNMRLSGLTLAAPNTCAFPVVASVAAGASQTCSFSTSIPWANFTTVAYNATISISANASVFTAGTGVAAPTGVIGSALFEVAPVASVGLAQSSWLPSTINASGVATSNLTWGNDGTVNLTHVTLGASSNVPDPRVAAIIIACAGFTQNGTLPAGSSLLQCTEMLNFQNVTYIEGGDVVFNITAAADNGVVRTQQVTIPVANTPALTLKLNTSKCSAPAATNNKAGSVITCAGAINLANTGSVRLAVDDVLVSSTIGVQAATCTLAGTTLNLTATNATLLPSQSLVCSFSVVTTQAAYEAGHIIFGVEAVGVAAYGTHPDLTASGVIGGVVPSSPANVTLTRTTNVTVQSSVIGSVRSDGDIVTYRVVVSNTGNLQLGAVELATTLAMPAWDMVGWANLTDGLDVGETVVLASNVTANKTMIRAGNIALSTNISANSSMATTNAASFATIVMPTCTDNRTVAPSDHFSCRNDTECGDPNLRCDLSGPLAPRYTCYGGAVDVDFVYGRCVYTACRRCKLCLADMAAHVGSLALQADTSRASVANQLSIYCSGKVSVNRTASACEAAVNATRDVNVNLGKRAGAICALLGECDARNLTVSCNLATAGGTSPAVPGGALDLCTIAGTNTSTQAPGVDTPSTPLARPNCTTDVHCNYTAESTCASMYPGTRTRTVCDPATGADTTPDVGICQPTDCRGCRQCFATMKAFAASNAAETDARSLAARFRTTCATLNPLALYFNDIACAYAASAIEASVNGNLGKRPAWICSQLYACSSYGAASDCVVQANTTATDTALTKGMLDMCTTNGVLYAAGGALVRSTPGVIINAAENATSLNVTGTSDCYSDADCDAGKCSYASPKQWCQCFSNNGSDACTYIGKCVAAATCANCAKCVEAVLPFVRSQQAVMDPAAVAAAWASRAAGIIAAVGAGDVDAAVVSGVTAAISTSPNGNLGKRAGALCNQLQFCVPSFVSSGCATINASIITDGGNTTTYVASSLDLCAVEGILDAGTTTVPGAQTNLTNLPVNTCNFATGRCDADHECDITKPMDQAICMCDAASGQDDCASFTACVKTPCKRCSDCLAHMTHFALNNTFATDEAALRTALQAHCARTYGAQACATLVSADSLTSIRQLKRAGAICQKLAECPAGGIQGCTLRSAGANGTDGVLDLCSIQGVTGADSTDVPSTSRDALIPGMCDTDAHCADTSRFYCDKLALKDFWKCTPSTGSDTYRQLGTCRLKPAVACGDCLAAFAGWVANTNAAPYTTTYTPDALAAEFKSNCTALAGRSAAACAAAAQGIATSFRGNAGRRAGAICAMLQECKAANVTGVTLTPTGLPGPAGNLSVCTQEGTSAGAVVQDFPITRVAGGKCTETANCAAGQFCDFAASGAIALGDAGSCVCSEATGRDTCARMGVCAAKPCTKCQACLTAMRDATNTSAPGFNPLSATFTGKCTGLLPSATQMCTDIVTNYFARSGVPNGYFTLRAGAACTAMQQCINLPATCAPALQTTRITLPATNFTGPLDTCAAEGILGGTQLNRVLMAGTIPASRCRSDADCITSQQCDTKNTTNYFVCAGGLDTVTSYGTCVPKPAALTGTQDQCALCLASVRAGVDTAAATPGRNASTLAASFYTTCSSAGYSLAACSRVQAVIASSHNGNLAKRAGAVCVRVGACLARSYSVAANVSALAPAAPVVSNAAPVNATVNGTEPVVSNTPLVRTITGPVDTCTIEGIAGGTTINGTYLLTDATPSLTCALDSDCAAGSFCSSDALVKVCRCVDGLDSCDFLPTCRPKPVVAVVAADTRTDCKKCQDCLAITQPWIAANALTSNDSFALAAAFATNCTGTLGDAAVLKCRAVASAIAFSWNGNLAKRAGALCARLGACSSEAASERCNVTTDARLDMCTQQGYVGGSAIYTATAVDNTTCSTDADCTTGSVCNMADANIFCSCNNGTDACVRRGTCQDFCASRSALIASVNAMLPSCASPFADCGTGLQCVASTQCKVLSCTPGQGITTTPCYGLCTPAARTLLSAKLADDGKSVTVALNTPARDASFPCVNLFDTATQGKIGSAALCSVSGSTLTVSLAPGNSLRPDVDTLVLAASQAVLFDRVTSAAFTSLTTAIVVAGCSNCAKPAVSIVGPTLVPEPCDPSTASDIIFDGSSSMDGMGRPLTTFAWSQVSTSDVVLSGAVSAANAANSPRLVIPGASLSQMANTAFTLQLTVTNFLGLTSSATATFSKVASGATPVVTVLGGAQQTFVVSEGIKVSAQLVPTSVCAGKAVQWSWAPAAGTTWAAIPAGYSRKDLVIPGPVVGLDGSAKVATLSASFAGSGAAPVSYNITLTPLASPIEAVLRGPSGDVRADRTIVLNASASVDPDDPASAQPPAVSWSCTRADFPTPCFSGETYGHQRGLSWAINGTDLAPGIVHTFTAAVAKGFRSNVANIVLTPSAQTIPTGRITRVCGGAACPPRHSADTPLALSLVLDAGAGVTTVAWSSDQVAGVGSASGNNDLVIAAASLPTSGAVTVTATLTSGGATSKTSITVPINGKPQCASPPCLAVTTVSNTFPSASFSAAAVGFTDDAGALRFDFGTVSGGVRKLLASSPSPTYTFAGLPVGATTVYVCAVDADGAALCQDAAVTVAAAASDFKVSDALAAFNISQLEGAKDVSVLAGGAQALQSLSKFADDNTAGQSAADKAAVQATIAVKTNALIKTLANDVNNYLDDPQTMQQVVSSVSTLTKTSKSLSSDSKAKVLAVGKAGITAAKISPKPLTPDSASRLLAVVAAGVGVPPASGLKLAAPTASRHLLAADYEQVAGGRQLLQTNDTASNDTSPSPSPAAPAAPLPPFEPAYTAEAADIAGLLLASATPATGYRSSGDSGLFIAVSNLPGRSYAGASPALVAGADLSLIDGSKADASVKDNVAVSFSGALTGNCTDDEGALLTHDAGCQVPVVAVYTPDASPALDGTGLTDALPDGFALVSGAVTLSVGGAASGALPCATTGCTASISFPVTEAANATQLYKCLRIAEGKLVVDNSVPDIASRAITATAGATPVFSCRVNQAGAYLVGKFPDPATVAGGVGEAATYDNITGYTVGQPVYTTFSFQVPAAYDYAGFIANAALVQQFKADVTASLAAGLRIPTSSISITAIRQGSIEVDVTFATTGLTGQQLNNLVGAVQFNPASLFSPAFLTTYGITGVTATVQAGTVAAPVAGLPIPAIVGGVVGGVGGALLVAAIAWLIVRRRRASGVEPRRGLLDEDHVA